MQLVKIKSRTGFFQKIRRIRNCSVHSIRWLRRKNLYGVILPKNPNYPEQLKYKSCKNEYVRSKSEALIAMNLYMEKIAYRYECELKIGKAVFYPDFTILHPLTGKEIYWEHFGKMDLPEYAKNAVDKLHMYARNGIYPGDRLITTYETMEQPLDTAIVQKLITYHFK